MHKYFYEGTTHMETFQRQSVVFLGQPVFLLQNTEEGKLCINLKTCACEGTFHLNLETWGGGQGKASSAGPPAPLPGTCENRR